MVGDVAAVPALRLKDEARAAGYPCDVNSFAVVIALLAVAAVGWLLTAAARRILRRRGIQTDERDRDDSR